MKMTVSPHVSYWMAFVVSVNFSGVVRGRLEKKRIVIIVTFFLDEYYEQ